MKILLLGKNGQVGWELQRSLSPLGELIALDHDSQDFCADFTNLAGLAATIKSLKPNVIVNAAAYTAVDLAESDERLAHKINAEAVGVLAQEASALGALLVHYSTDYVFDGSGTKPWQETDAPAPMNVYGATKLAGEQAILNASCKHLIFRTSWVYAVRGANFAKTMLRLAAERDALSVIDDQIGAPTGADLLADVTAQAISMVLKQPEAAGLYHLVARGEVSWHGYAALVIETARAAGWPIKVAPDGIKAVTSEAFVTPAKRPKNSRLSTKKIESTFGLRMPAWEHGVSRMLAEVMENKNGKA